MDEDIKEINPYISYTKKEELNVVFGSSFFRSRRIFLRYFLTTYFFSHIISVQSIGTLKIKHTKNITGKLF